METIEVTFPGGKRVDAGVGAYVVRTDQPVESGGSVSAVAPPDLFLASLASTAARCGADRLFVEIRIPGFNLWQNRCPACNSPPRGSR
jgi:hypothetical protein